ncbi:MAG: stress responsive alpha-beta barrel protein [Rhodoglobus sp.]|nr:stress responsive alpha-beta barrel protein [Rhodoglobus sp.]
MIRHIVLFTLAATDEAQRASDAAGMKQRLEGLVGQIPGLRTLTVSRDLGTVEGHFDLALVSDHDDNAALEGYQAHPAHKDVLGYVSSVVDKRAVVDFEL